METIFHDDLSKLLITQCRQPIDWVGQNLLMWGGNDELIIDNFQQFIQNYIWLGANIQLNYLHCWDSKALFQQCIIDNLSPNIINLLVVGEVGVDYPSYPLVYELALQRTCTYRAIPNLILVLQMNTLYGTSVSLEAIAQAPNSLNYKILD